MSFVVFSGGTACNNILEAFHKASLDHQVNYILGISDNGGSTSELLRVLGGPSVGDLRSRFLKLMDLFDTGNQEMEAVKKLLSYRLPIDLCVRDEWLLVLDGKHKLWQGILDDKRETIQRFLELFDIEILRSQKQFDFSHGSIGNFLLTGARLFTGSLDAALHLFASIIGVPVLVTPLINTNQTSTIAAILTDGTTLVGQCEISHPPVKECTNLFFSKHASEKLNFPIQRIFYTNHYGQEIFPDPNPKVISQISSQRSLVYSIGSLYTSLIPCLILKSIGNAIAQSQSLQHKILLLNGSVDRETDGYSALDFIHAITDALHQSQQTDARRTVFEKADLDTPPSSYPPLLNNLFYPSPVSAFITHLIYLDNTTIPVDVVAIERLGITCIPIQGDLSSLGDPIYLEHHLTQVIEKLVL